MANPTRFTKLGVSGKTATANNRQDSYVQTIEVPLLAILSGSAQDTGVKAPKTISSFGGYIEVTTAEATGTTKTVDVGLVGGTGDLFVTAVDVSATGPVGTVNTAVVDNTSLANFSYTLASADFEELDAVLVLWFVGSDV